MNSFFALLLVLLALGARFLFSIDSKDTIVSNREWVELPVRETMIISQSNEFSCGPAAILNALKFGRKVAALRDLGNSDSDRIKTIISEYGHMEHCKTRRSRFTPELRSTDLCQIVSEIRTRYNLPELNGLELNRLPGETSQSFVSRVHKLLGSSLMMGEPPIVHIHAECAVWKNQRKRFEWDSLCGHYVTIIAIQKHLPPNAECFSMEIVDSGDKRRKTLFVFDSTRDFIAMGSNGRWLSNRPFLSVAGPGLNLLTSRQEWSSRSEIYLMYAVYKRPDR